jgi:hypothetical protein
VLAEVVATAELLVAVGALEGFVVGVKRAIVTLQVCLATEQCKQRSCCWQSVQQRCTGFAQRKVP